MSQRKYPTYPENVDGDFYVECNGCCTLCGLPHAIGPSLFGEVKDEYCFVKKQPSNTKEMQQMIEVLNYQEFDCIRYSGSDRNIMEKIEDKHSLCDNHPNHQKAVMYNDSCEEAVENTSAKQSILNKFLNKIKNFYE